MLELIRSREALEMLRPQWDDLHSRCELATPFQASAWLLPWARHFAPDRLMAFAVREYGVLVALLPFFSWQNCLLLAGSGPTDYCDGLFASRSHVDEVLAALADYAAEIGCSCIDLRQVPAQSPLLAAAAPPHWASEVNEGTPCPVASFTQDALAPVSPRWRKNVARARRKLGQRVDFDLRCTSTELFDGAAAEVVRLHSQRWRQRDQEGVLADRLMRGFLVSALPELSTAGLLRLHTLDVGRPVAVLLGVHSREMTCFYIGGFDPQWSAYSPGSILLEAAMLQAVEDGAREFHFLRGREGYKYHFGAQDRPTFHRVLTRAHAS